MIKKQSIQKESGYYILKVEITYELFNFFINIIAMSYNK
jgi:hypothetical protein